jgi:hypothetical protein
MQWNCKCHRVRKRTSWLRWCIGRKAFSNHWYRVWLTLNRVCTLIHNLNSAEAWDDLSLKCYKGFRSLNVLALVDHRYKIRWISDFWGGNNTDARVRVCSKYVCDILILHHADVEL